MKREVWRGQNSLRFLYYRYKDSPYYSLIILSVVIIACFVLILNIVIPQIYNWFSVRDEVIATQGRINTIHRNLDFMSLQVNKTTLENNRQIALRALPVDKDFGDIVNAIAISAVNSGVSVDDFSFNPGQTSQSDLNSAKPGLNLSSIKVTLSLTGGIKETSKFIAEISQKLPVNEVQNVDTSNGRSTISILFYSKPYKASAIQLDQPIKVISAENGNLLGTLSGWNDSMNILSGSGNQPPPASSEAIPLF